MWPLYASLLLLPPPATSGPTDSSETWQHKAMLPKALTCSHLWHIRELVSHAGHCAQARNATISGWWQKSPRELHTGCIFQPFKSTANNTTSPTTCFSWVWSMKTLLHAAKLGQKTGRNAHSRAIPAGLLGWLSRHLHSYQQD